jgi:Ca2+-binding RTX toxin-like protein
MISGDGMTTITGDNTKNDTLVGSDGADEIFGLGGDDKLVGGAGRDILHGGDGNDYLEAGGFGDFNLGSTAYGKAADDVLDGGAGNSDTAYLDYSDLVNVATDEPIVITYMFGANSQVQIQGFTGATITNVENIFIKLADGDDNVTLGAGNDTVWGGQGDDIIKLGGGDDVVFDVGGKLDFDGGDGTDTLRIDWRTYNWAMTLDLDSGKIQAFGDDAPSGDYGTAVGFEHLDMFGSLGMDTVFGGADTDSFLDSGGGAYFDGRGGDDIASASGGPNITLIGGAGNDTLSTSSAGFLDGGIGNDTLTGSSGGNDTLRGGDGNDIIHVQEDGLGFDDDVDAGGGDDIVYAGFNFGGNAGTAILSGGGGDDRLVIELGANHFFDAQTD